jgi:hypothetical protein
VPSLIGYEPPKGTSEFYSKLFSPITSRLEEGYGDLGGARERFYGEVSPQRTYESTGGEGLIEAALGDTANRQAYEDVEKLLGARYTGPAGLDPEALRAAEEDVAYLTPQAPSLDSAAGFQALLEQRLPHLTAGERRFEAGRALEDPAYREAAQELRRDIGQFRGDVGTEAGAARELAQTRAEEEAAIARQARESLTGRKEDITEDLEGRIREATERDRLVEETIQRFNETGNLEDLERLEGLGFDPREFDTEATRLEREAKVAKAAVMDDPRFAAIRDVPLMELGVTSRGRETHRFPDEWFEANKGRLSKNSMKRIKALAKERQKALDDAGFRAASWKRDVGDVAGGRFAGLEPIYHTEGEDPFTIADTRPYVNLETGTGATRHNIATEGEREKFNTIGSLLGDAERLEETDPHQAARIVADVLGYAEDQKQQYIDTLQRMNDIGEEWGKVVSRARQKYKKSQKFGAKLTRGISNILGDVGMAGSMGGIEMGGKLWDKTF